MSVDRRRGITDGSRPELLRERELLEELVLLVRRVGSPDRDLVDEVLAGRAQRPTRHLRPLVQCWRCRT